MGHKVAVLFVRERSLPGFLVEELRVRALISRTAATWLIAEVAEDPVLTGLHKLERECLTEVKEATRHGVCVDESSACYV